MSRGALLSVPHLLAKVAFSLFSGPPCGSLSVPSLLPKVPFTLFSEPLCVLRCVPSLLAKVPFLVFLDRFAVSGLFLVVRDPFRPALCVLWGSPWLLFAAPRSFRDYSSAPFLVPSLVIWLSV